MPSPLLSELKRWKLKCPKGEQELVFPNTLGKPENNSNVLRRVFHPALRRAGLRKVRFHDLRHTYASLLIANGEHPKYIQTQMGHSSIKVTMDTYGHLMQATNAQAAEKLATLALGSKTCSNYVATGERTKRKKRQVTDFNGGPCRNRTCDHLIKSQMLCQLS